MSRKEVDISSEILIKESLWKMAMPESSQTRQSSRECTKTIKALEQENTMQEKTMYYSGVWDKNESNESGI